MNRFSLLIMSVLFATLNHAQSQVETEYRLYKDAASLGMGGVGVSTIGYSFSPIYNPANLGLMADHDIAPFISVGLAINPAMLSLLNKVKDSVSDPSKLTDVNFDSLVDTAPSASLNGPINAGYMGKGFGFWTTSSSDISVALQKNQDNIFAQNNLDVSVNSLVAAGNDIKNLYDSGQTFSEQQLLDIFHEYLGDELLDQGLSDQQVTDTLTHLAQEVQKDPNILRNLIPKARFAAVSEIAVNIGYGYKIAFKGIDDVSGLSLGATVRFSQRFRLDSGDFKPIDQIGDYINSIANNISGNVYQAGSISSDFGASLRIQNWILGVSVLDAISTRYQWKNFDGIRATSGGISQIPMSINVGTSYRFIWDNNFIQGLSLHAEVSDILNKNIGLLDKIRLGSELKLFNFLNLRVGMYNTFITGGLGFDWKWFKLDFAYYRENYYNIFKSDQFYVNMTFGLDNSPARKHRSYKKQLEQDRIQSQAMALIDKSLEEVNPQTI